MQNDDLKNQSLTVSSPNLPRPIRSLRRPVGELLAEAGLITPTQLRHALHVQASNNAGFLGQILISLGYVAPRELGRFLSESLGISYVDLSDEEINPDAVRLLPEALIRERMVLPLRVDEENLWLAMADPLDLDVTDSVGLQTGRRVIPLLSFSSELLPAINRSHNFRERAEMVMRELSPEAEDEESEQDLLGKAENAPVVRLVNTLIDGAFDGGASDIHMEPQEDGMRVRYRVDGILYEQMLIPRASQRAVVSRVKVISGMDIAERRRPQDGRISRNRQGRSFDLRVSTMPTVHGEKAVLRVLDKSAMNVTLEQIGFLPEELARWNRLIVKPYGMVLVTGPTGSGKSTTLYSSLNQINDPGKNIATIEDPVEYQLKGINQTQVNVRAGVTFAEGLKTLVRQDPDIILVGEVRDKETAEMAINAALTGHLVFATLHTNDAPGAVVRLDNMGIEPFLVTSSVQGVIGQRLLRKICDGCKTWYDADPALLGELGLPEKDDAGRATQLARGTGCRDCSGKGYRGRTAVFEVMVMSDSIQRLVLRRESSAVIKEEAIRQGMMPMRQSAIRKIAMGITTPDEMARVILDEETAE
ncbi:MAG: ATPase, T2SS/T4P/T4SS family [Armatimonadota bacterium]